MLQPRPCVVTTSEVAFCSAIRHVLLQVLVGAPLSCNISCMFVHGVVPSMMTRDLLPLMIPPCLVAWLHTCLILPLPVGLLVCTCRTC